MWVRFAWETLLCSFSPGLFFVGLFLSNANQKKLFVLLEVAQADKKSTSCVSAWLAQAIRCCAGRGKVSWVEFGTTSALLFLVNFSSSFWNQNIKIAVRTIYRCCQCYKFASKYTFRFIMFRVQDSPIYRCRRQWTFQGLFLTWSLSILASSVSKKRKRIQWNKISDR